MLSGTAYQLPYEPHRDRVWVVAYAREMFRDGRGDKQRRLTATIP